MSRERVVLCGGTAAADLPVADETPLRLQLYGRGSNVTLKLNDIEWQLLSRIPPVFQDLIEIATYVYCADQAIPRGGAGIEDLGLAWRRRLHFRIPVRHPEVWSDPTLRTKLCTTLGFLSDDEYSFDFTKLTSAPAGTQFLFPADQNVEEVVLYSGGLDSLCGAVREAVVAGRQIALVRHRSTAKLENRTQHLNELLAAKCPRPPLHFTLDISKAKHLSREYTQRARSFLYVALGATVAQMLGLARVRFYENGVVSFNLPPTVQVVGAKATRTTHPQVLNGFADILTMVAGRRFTVENLLLWHTKAEVVRAIKSAGCDELVNFSNSCAHTWEKTRRHPHCGSCSQCIDRRFATLGEQATDDPDGYTFDLLLGAPEDGDDLAMLASYVETASRVAKMTAPEFFARFGEAARVLRHVDGTPDQVAQRLFELHQRHALQVSSVVDAAIASHAKELRERTLHDNCLLRLVCDASSPAVQLPADPKNAASEKVATVAAPASSPPDRVNGAYLFQRKGSAWFVRFGGGQELVVLPTKGADYLHRVLAKPGVAIPVTKLAADVAGQPVINAAGSAGEKSDPEALRAFRAEYERLQGELDDARERGDAEGEARIRGDMAQYAARIQSDIGLNGRIRTEHDDKERVRKSVANAIKRTIDEIGKYDESFATHLRSAVSRGRQVCYVPHPEVEWQT